MTDAMYRQDVAPFEEGFDVLARELAAALPGWGDRLAHPSPAERAGLLLRTMRNAAGLSQAKLGETAGVKQSDISGSGFGPSSAWVFIDEHPDSINDGLYRIDMQNSDTTPGGNGDWPDYPALKR